MKAKHHQKDDQRKVEEKQSNDNISKAIVRSFFEWRAMVCVLFVKERERLL